jgi:hypothetical protein
MPRTDNDKLAWLQNFSSKVGDVVPRYGITPAEISDISRITADFGYRLSVLDKIKTYGASWTRFKNDLRDGIEAGSESLPPPALDLGTAPLFSDPGAFKRIANYVQRIKGHPSYAVADGENLGIETSGETMPATEDLKPVLKLKTGNGGKPQIIWEKGLGRRRSHLQRQRRRLSVLRLRQSPQLRRQSTPASHRHNMALQIHLPHRRRRSRPVQRCAHRACRAVRNGRCLNEKAGACAPAFFVRDFLPLRH